MSDNQTCVLYAAGDVGPTVCDPIKAFDHVISKLKEADIRFCQLERVFSERGAVQVQSGAFHSRVPPDFMDGIASAGFNIVSLASNHSGDWGPDALMDTLELCHKKEIATIGAGRNIDEARRPAMVHKHGVRIAFLAYCSVLREGYWATENRAGAVPLRASTYYEQMEYQPGTAPRIVTIPNQDDVCSMRKDICEARKQADVVIVSLHWGIHLRPKIIAMYQPTVGHQAIEAGADIVIGHHAHMIKGIEVYKGKAIFYSIGNFVMDGKLDAGKGSSTNAVKDMYHLEMDPEYPTYPYPAEARKSMTVKCVMSRQGVERVSFLPVMINKKSQPEVVPRSDPQFEDVYAYSNLVSEEFGTRLSIQGNEIVVPIG
jgi:hypothetical protein